MMRQLFQHLNTRLAITAALFLLLLLLASLFFVSKVFYESTHELQQSLGDDISTVYTQGHDQQLIELANFLSAKLFTLTYDTDISGLNEQISRVSPWVGAESIIITDRDGIVLTDGTTENVQYGTHVILPDGLHEARTIQIDRKNGHRQLYFIIGNHEQTAGYGLITLALEQRFALQSALNANIDKALERFKHGFDFFAITSVLFILFACSGLGFWLYRSLSLPILTMIKAAEEYSIGNYNHAVPSSFRSNSEVGRLASALNKMAENIQEAEEKIIYQAHFDNLTGLPNRFLILDRLELSIKEALRNQSDIAVFFLDLDGFKKVNDSLGHDIGDKLLIEAAQRISSALRKGDTVGRLGGDEFIVLLKGLTKSEDAKLSAESIHTAFKPAFNIDGRDLAVTTSIGIATYPENGETAAELLKNADSAMYHAKAQGRNTYAFFSQEMNERLSRQLQLEEQLTGALQRGEFKVVYQPKLDVESKKIVGAEALLRWHNQELGFVSPEEFIPILEQTALIAEVGQFVLEQSISQVAHWRKQFDSTFSVAINISPRQLRISNLPLLIDELLIHYQTVAEAVELEITEGVLMETHVRVKHVLNNLSKRGLSIAMDDFGQGYSSLSYLRNFPFDVVKIDRSFVNDITTDPNDRELISAAIAMAHALKLKVVAEGVETEEQLQFLKTFNCDLAQGYLFSKPVDVEAFNELLEQQTETDKEAIIA